MDSIILEWISGFYQWSDELQSSATSPNARGLEAIFRGLFWVFHKIVLLVILAFIIALEINYFPTFLYWTAGAVISIELLHVIGQRI